VTPKRPPGWSCITPRIVAKDAAALVEFLQHVFGAVGDYRRDAPCILDIGDSKLMISEAGPRPPSPAFLYVYVVDLQATYRRALERQARVIEAPLLTHYGDRRCMLEDAWGNTWQIASYEGDLVMAQSTT
jgi:PhnB protein